MSELIFLMPWYLGCAWAADRFCKKFLRIAPCRKYVFPVGAFIIWMVVDLVRELFSLPYIVAALMIHILLAVLIIESFQEIWEKRYWRLPYCQRRLRLWEISVSPYAPF